MTFFSIITLLQLGICLQNLEKFQEAIECYDKALTIDELHVNSHNFKGISLNSLAKVHQLYFKKYKKILIDSSI